MSLPFLRTVATSSEIRKLVRKPDEAIRINGIRSRSRHAGQNRLPHLSRDRYMAADSSPSCSKTVRMAAASAALTTNMARDWSGAGDRASQPLATANALRRPMRDGREADYPDRECRIAPVSISRDRAGR
jgi:hypothetical protein